MKRGYHIPFFVIALFEKRGKSDDIRSNNRNNSTFIKNLADLLDMKIKEGVDNGFH